MSGPSFELDYDVAIGNARRVFSDMFGADAEFLPRAPDPEEIVIGGGESNEECAETVEADKTSENTESLKNDAEKITQGRDNLRPITGHVMWL